VKPTSEVLQAIVERIRAPIPHRPTPQPRPRKSWQGLKVGDRLSRGAFTWEVEACTTAGATLRCVAPFVGNTLLYLTDPRDMEGLAKVAKPRRARRKKEPNSGDQ
jgi:hypothetical protein